MDAMDSPILLRSRNCNRRHINRNLTPSPLLTPRCLNYIVAVLGYGNRPLPAYIKNVMLKTPMVGRGAFPAMASYREPCVQASPPLAPRPPFHMAQLTPTVQKNICTVHKKERKRKQELSSRDIFGTEAGRKNGRGIHGVHCGHDYFARPTPR